ncbi:MAG: hypothetical protein AAGJ83_12375 [Planctomycetota bacterium]
MPDATISHDKKWSTLKRRIRQDWSALPASDVFGEAVRRGGLYRWGISISQNGPCCEEEQWLSRLACGVAVGQSFGEVNPRDWIIGFHESLPSHECRIGDVSRVLLYAAAMPKLLSFVDEDSWWSLLGTIQSFRDSLMRQDCDPLLKSIGVAEIGLTLAWSLRALPTCVRALSSSLQSLSEWLDHLDFAVSKSLEEPSRMRIALASGYRQRCLLRALRKHSGFPKKKGGSDRKRCEELLPLVDELVVELATWCAALTRNDGTSAFSEVGVHDARDDSSKRGLLRTTASLDPECLLPAMNAALGDNRSRGRLAWKVHLPESMLHDEDAKIACLLPEWDVRRSRAVFRYRDEQTDLELTAGKRAVILGKLTQQILVDGSAIHPQGEWVNTCEYSDDDVHYLEVERVYERGFVIQRQFMVVREDRCCLLADAIVPGEITGDGAGQGRTMSGASSRDDSPPWLEYQLRVPLGTTINATPETETNEWLLGTGKPQAMVFPLAANEWKSGPGHARLSQTDDHQLLFSIRGRGALFAPLWIDFDRKRVRKPKTWRKLTVGERLEVIPESEAAAFRLQVGSEHWMLYRSLRRPEAPRTFFGKQVMADFYCGRFDAEEQSYEDLITVENN